MQSPVPRFRAGAPRVCSTAIILDLDLRKVRKSAAARDLVQFEDKIRVEVDARGKTVTTTACHQPRHENLGPECTRYGVAKMKYDDRTHEWTLCLSDSNRRWHDFDLIDPCSIDGVFEEVTLGRACVS